MVLNLIILVVLVLVVFEGRLVYTMFNLNSITVTAPKPSESGNSNPSSSHTSLNGSSDSGDKSGQHATAANGGTGSATASAVRLPKNTNSYFSDAVLVCDSRMEGFRNVSGITQGRFFTRVGMSLSGLIGGSIINTPQGKITVAAAVSGGVYNKVYVMLGTNDLGEFDLEGFHDRFTQATGRLRELQPNAVFYICSIIYVEESKVTTGEYVNNTNVDKLNAILLQICEEQGYHYLDLNEILSDGNGSLIPGASSDGVHMYEQYCKQMLEYVKNHYVEEKKK